MTHILCIETSTTVCSVCVTADDTILAHKEINNGFSHAQNLHVFIQDVLKEANLSIKQINVVAVSKGPGSYTGLRIGVSTAKGLCYALQIPLISIDTLQSIAHHVQRTMYNVQCLYGPMLDARRMEVYCAVYGNDLEIITPVKALVLDEKSIEIFNFDKPVYFFGDGMSKAKYLLQAIKNSFFIEDVYPSAESMAVLAFNKFKQNKFEDVAYFEPFYLKEFFTYSKPKKG